MYLSTGVATCVTVVDSVVLEFASGPSHKVSNMRPSAA